jgi:hypothetical protein
VISIVSAIVLVAGSALWYLATANACHGHAAGGSPAR